MNSTAKKILVVDDEKEVTLTLKGLFSALGHDMLTAQNGDDAIRLIDTQKPALVLLDVRMPGVDGIEILKKLRREKSGSKVIIITTYAKETKEEVEALGIDGFFPKPIDLNALNERIRFVLDSKNDTRFYPSKVKDEPIRQTPKAKLLFIEPNPVVYGFTCAFFNIKEMSNGEYEARVAYDATEGLKELYSFRPDFVVMYDSLHHMEDVMKLAEVMMAQSHRPKKVILHGLIPKTDREMCELEKKGITFCNQNSLDHEGLKRLNQLLVDFVARECVKMGLVK